MKSTYSILLFMILSNLVLCQEEKTLVGGARIKGGFGGPFFVYGQAESHDGGGAGGGGGVIINDFFFGGFGQGESFGQHDINGLNYNMNLGQGGFWGGYVWPSHRIVHGIASFKLGFGDINLI